MKRLVPMLLLGLICSCRSAGVPRDQAAARGGVSHAVFFYLKNPGDAAARRQIMQASQTFRQIPGVLAVRTGTMIPSTRPVVDSTYDVAVVITFASEQAMHEYDAHPLHRQAVNGLLKELVSKIVIYDFRNQP